jgi:hypothetical protein
MPLDEAVLRAMARWPQVPAVHGWLRLTRRGRWMLIDRGRPDFDAQLHGAGSEITSPPILDFIGRNYQPDAQGRWAWQNGPQRVFVDLDLAPLYFRVLEPAGLPQATAAHRAVVSHTGYPVERIERVAIDAQDHVWLLTDLGPGCIDDRDLALLDLELEGPEPRLRLLGDHPVEWLQTPAEIAFGFDPHPKAASAG